MSKSNPRSLNNWTVLVFGPVLVVTGILGYVTPDHLALMSGASPYNLFHIFFGCLALGIALSGHEQAALRLLPSLPRGGLVRFERLQPGRDAQLPVCFELPNSSETPLQFPPDTQNKSTFHFTGWVR